MDNFLIQAVTEFGFPAVMCFYLIIKTTKAIDNNTQALEKLERQIEKLIDSK